MYAIFGMGLLSFISPKGERGNSCALQYASLVISNFPTSCDVLVSCIYYASVSVGCIIHINMIEM